MIAIGGEDTLGVAHKLSGDGCTRRRRAEDDRQRSLGDRLHVRLPHRGADRDRRDRPSAHDGREPRPGDGRRGDGPTRGLDRDVLGTGRRRRHDPRAREAVRHRRGVRAHPAPPRARRQLLDRRGRRRRDAGEGDDGAADRRARRVRARPAGRHRPPAGGRDRGAHRLRGAHDAARPPAPRRDADGLRPRRSRRVSAWRRSTPCTKATSA